MNDGQHGPQAPSIAKSHLFASEHVLAGRAIFPAAKIEGGHRRLDEGERKRYFASYYPADLVSTLVGHDRCANSQGPTRARDEEKPAASTITKDLSSADTLKRHLYGAEGAYSLHIQDTIGATFAGTECCASVVQHEFVVDVDLKDYKERRDFFCGCGPGKSVCDRCWLLAEITAAICEAIVSNACGLGPMLCVASGGKGFHLWWGTPQARRLSRRKRKALLALLTLRTSEAKGVGEQALMDVWTKRGIVHRALLADINSPIAQYLAGAAGPSFAWPSEAAVAQLLPGARSQKRWAAYVAHVGRAQACNVVRLATWPEFDEDVTLGRGHLLKAPFSIHHSTDKVALPLPSIRHCLPSQLPTVRAVMEGDAEAGLRFADGCATLRAWLVACQYGPQYDFYNV